MKILTLPTTDQALPGRTENMPVSNRHFVNQHPIQPPFPQYLETVVFGLGCFWGAERLFWQQTGVYSTAVGYAAGITPNPTYKEVCTGLTGHNEVVLVVFDPRRITFQQLLEIFWQAHDPTQGMRQGYDTGSQYRSGIYCYDRQQLDQAEASKQHYQRCLTKSGHGAITTEILSLKTFYYAEDYHQQYLAKNPNGYCGLKGISVNYERDAD